MTSRDGGKMLAIGVCALSGLFALGVCILAVIIGLGGRALAAQRRGEELQIVAMLLDEQLNLVLMRGPDEYAARFDTEGACDAPYGDYSYRIEIGEGESGNPYHVRATVSWLSAGRLQVESAETYMSPRLGDDPDPIRQPKDPVDRWE